MTRETQNKREAIRLKVVEAIPEILELKFGCEILINSSKTIDTIYKVRSDDDGRAIYFPTGWINEYFYQDDFEIIGRPILAQDILRALEKNVLDEIPSISARGNIYFERIDLGRRWMLNLDLSQNLSQWSQETIDELYKLMCE